MFVTVFGLLLHFTKVYLLLLLFLIILLTIINASAFIFFLHSNESRFELFANLTIGFFGASDRRIDRKRDTRQITFYYGQRDVKVPLWSVRDRQIDGQTSCQAASPIGRQTDRQKERWTERLVYIRTVFFCCEGGRGREILRQWSDRMKITPKLSCLAEANLAEGIDKTITKSVNISLVDNLKMGQRNT